MQSETQSQAESETLDAQMEEERLADVAFDNAVLGTDDFDNVSNTSCVSGSRASTPVSGISMTKKRKAPQNDVNDLFRELLAQRPKATDFMPQKPVDNVQQFFDSMASTVRKFSPLAIARIKLKIAQIVGEEEIAWAQQPPVEFIYVQPETIEQQATGGLPHTSQTNESDHEMEEEN